MTMARAENVTITWVCVYVCVEFPVNHEKYNFDLVSLFNDISTFMGYLMPKFDTSNLNTNMFSSDYSYLMIIILHTIIWYRVFLSNGDNLHRYLVSNIPKNS